MVVVQIGWSEYMNGVGRILNNNGILMCNVESYLAVEGQEDRCIPLIQPDLNGCAVREDERTIGQGKGTDWCKNDCPE